VRRVLLGLLSVAAVAAGVPASAAAPAAPTPLPWLHVDHTGGGLPLVKDAAGRTVLLRGANVNGLQDGYYSPRTHDSAWTKPVWPVDPTAYAPGQCPTNSHRTSDPPLCEVDAGKPRSAQSGAFDSRNDFAQMRALGFNIIRLTLSWSQLEPTPGKYNATYLDRIAQVVEWAREQGIYVLLDMHQDNYSRFIDDTAAAEVPPVLTTVKQSGGHADGAPPWAILTDGVPGLAPFGIDVFNLQMGAAFNSFWINRPAPVPQGDAPGTGVQDHYIGAMAALARRFKGDSAVVGYEIMNEPQSGVLAVPGAFDQAFLFPFYTRVVDAITGTNDGGYRDLGIHDVRHLFFFEPWALRNLIDASAQVNAPFTRYANLVYAPHTYTHVFTLDSTAGLPVPYPPSYDQAFETAASEATSLGAALWVGEFGNGSTSDEIQLRNLTAAQDRHLTGSAVWAWKGNCGRGDTVDQCKGTWATFAGDTRDPPAQNLQLKPSREKFLSRIVPWSTAGTLLRMQYDPDARTFAMSVAAGRRVDKGDLERETVLFIPARVTGAVRVADNAVLDRIERTPDGNRIAYVAPTGGGVYAVTVA
jgi:endoglycosylceramidase